MDSSDDRPLDPASAAELVVRMVDAIDTSDYQLRAALLCDLLSAGWGSARAQRQ